MNMRQLIIGIIIVSAVFALIMAGIIGVFKYKPELIGIKDKSDTTKVKKIEKPVKKETPVILHDVYYEPTVEISQEMLEKLELGLLKNDDYIVKIDSLKNIEKYLRDSLKSGYSKEMAYRDSLKRSMSNFSNILKEKNFLSDSLSRTAGLVKSANEKYENAKKRIENYESLMESRIDTASRSNFETFAKIYENSKPAEVARILEQLDERDAAKILKKMSRKKAGKVLESMKPENAAAILLLGVGQ